uniref:Uncharacterized protein n=1 Tax=Trichuris muris TaxID=70415 RepID=A0A5S6R0J6_TRIMR
MPQTTCSPTCLDHREADLTMSQRRARSPKRAQPWLQTSGSQSWILRRPLCSLLVPPSWLRDIAPAVNIQPFDGDPLKWDMFISSFKSLVHDVVGSNAQRLSILRQLLTPSLRSALASSLHSAETYAHALQDLRRLYGDTNAVIAACFRKLSGIEPMKPRNDADVERFYLELHGAPIVLRARGRSVELKSAYTLQAIIPKMTGYLRQKWAQKVFDLRPREATLEDLDLWLERIILVNRLIEPVEVNGGECSTTSVENSVKLQSSALECRNSG